MINHCELYVIFQDIIIEENNKIALSSNDDKGVQSIDSIKTYAYGMTKDLVSQKEEIKCSNIMKTIQTWLTLIML